MKETLRITGFVMLIACCAYVTVGIFTYLYCGEVIENILLSLAVGKWGAFIIIMFTIFIMGMFIDWIGIIMITAPIIVPIAPYLGFNQLWFAIMICVNLQMAFLTPPFASAIFILKGNIKPQFNITNEDIIRGTVPFILLIIIALAIFTIFPQIILWLPDKMIK
jgi:TRAP-type mannitol/chloroaromatic compound transport system permease large subunit